jgi:hypothetical protein
MRISRSTRRLDINDMSTRQETRETTLHCRISGDGIVMAETAFLVEIEDRWTDEGGAGNKAHISSGDRQGGGGGGFLVLLRDYCFRYDIAIYLDKDKDRTRPDRQRIYIYIYHACHRYLPYVIIP